MRGALGGEGETIYQRPKRNWRGGREDCGWFKTACVVRFGETLSCRANGA